MALDESNENDQVYEIEGFSYIVKKRDDGRKQFQSVAHKGGLFQLWFQAGLRH